jgi:alanyl-tRNA synthetase
VERARAAAGVTRLLYRDDPYLLEFDAAVVARRTHGGRPAVVLDQTAFYAESGGQPWDTGTLDDARVVAVQHVGGEVVHVVDRAPEADRVHGRVDAARRRDHMQQHHGQHLLSRALVEIAGAPTVSFRLGEAVSTIDVTGDVPETALRAAEARANEVVWRGHPVAVRTMSRAEAAAAGVHVPEEAGDRVRVVDAEGFDRQACGGTHPRTTSEVGVVVVLGHERYKAGTRVRFVCGARAVDALHRRQAIVDDLAATLSAAPDAIADAVRRLRDTAGEADKRVRALQAQALEGEARRLLANAAPGNPTVVAAALDGYAPADLRALAGHVVALAPSIALLGSRHEGRAHLVFARSPGRTEDVAALLVDALARIGGRGGGRGDVVQGGGDRVDALDEAIRTASGAARPSPPSPRHGPRRFPASESSPPPSSASRRARS